MHVNIQTPLRNNIKTSLGQQYQAKTPTKGSSGGGRGLRDLEGLLVEHNGLLHVVQHVVDRGSPPPPPA